ncbi:MAG TPA: PKD domain-containing protein [Ktedonobacterales bacterium]|nr:PKD domain-containing protein [Ktedonobacterales bacterium]
MGCNGLTVRRRDSWRQSSRYVAARLARSLVLALMGGCLLALLVTTQQGERGELPAALACGLGNPQTMLANKIPALLYPVTQDMPQDAPQGVFPLDYAVGTSIAFTEDLSRVPGAPKLNSFRWEWNFGDGTGNVYVEIPTHTFTKPGTYYVGSWVWDTTSNSWSSFDSAQIHIVSAIVGNAPMAKATSDMAVTAIGQSVTFDAAGSHSNDGSQLKYLWNFNDGTTATTPHVVHQFPLNGTTFAAVIVTDARGAQSMATVNITIQAQAPTAALNASDLEVDAGSTVSFDASQSVAPKGVVGDAIAKYIWDFGDGTKPQTTQTPTTSHVYQKAGSYKVTLTVFDKPGAQASATLRMKVLGAANGGVSPLVIIGGILLLVGLGIGIYAFWQRRRRAEMVRRYQEAQALARAHRGQRGSRAQLGGAGSRRQPAMRGGPPASGPRRLPDSNGSPAGYSPRDSRDSHAASSPGRPPRRQDNSSRSSGRDGW